MPNTQLKSWLKKLSTLTQSWLNQLSTLIHHGHLAAPAGTYVNRQLFDVPTMENEATRRQRRRKLLLWSLPGVILMLLIALWFLLPTPLTYKAIKSYNHKGYQTARDWLTPLTWTSPQQFVIAFNSGTVDTQLGKYTRAQTELTRALTLAPADKRCMVLQNLVYSLDAHAATLQQEVTSATTYDAQAAALRNQNPKCFHTLPGGNDNGGGGGGGGGASAQSQQVLSQAQQQELQQKDQQGQASEQQDFNPNSVNPNSPNVKPW